MPSVKTKVFISVFSRKFLQKFIRFSHKSFEMLRNSENLGERFHESFIVSRKICDGFRLLRKCPIWIENNSRVVPSSVGPIQYSIRRFQKKILSTFPCDSSLTLYLLKTPILSSEHVCVSLSFSYSIFYVSSPFCVSHSVSCHLAI